MLIAVKICIQGSTVGFVNRSFQSSKNTWSYKNTNTFREYKLHCA